MLAGLDSMPVVVCAQPSKSKTVLPAHTIRIRDNHASNSEARLKSLRLENEADTLFVNKSWSEDMGHVYAVGYRFKEKIPDGIYRYVVNDTIESETVFVNGKLEGMQKRYMNGTLWEETPYHLGKANGYGRSYDWESPYNVHLIGYHYEGDLYIITGVNAVGEIISRSYFMPGDGSGGPYRKEEKKSGWSDYASPLTRNGATVKDGILRNGLYELASPFGKYQLLFKDNLITWWKWLDRDGKLVVEVHAQPGQRL
jgi:antitoxin component YwqK of YwqJK toxin-antitoxin module